MYWPREVATSMELGSMIISNNGYNVDSKNRNIHMRELELNIEDSDYVRLYLEKCRIGDHHPGNPHPPFSPNP